MTSAKDQALKMLSRRGYAVAELRRKLKEKEFAYKSIQETIEWLLENRFLDDASFTATRIKYRAESSRWGKLKILHELKQKGVPEDIINAEMMKFEEGLDQPLDPELPPQKIRDEHDWQAEAEQLLQKRFGIWPKELSQGLPKGLEAEAAQKHYKAVEKEKNRRVSFLLRRGFNTQQALTALSKQLDGKA
jgi:SOS response regulatory protein OraA/RecX